MYIPVVLHFTSQSYYCCSHQANLSFTPQLWLGDYADRRWLWAVLLIWWYSWAASSEWSWCIIFYWQAYIKSKICIRLIFTESLWLDKTSKSNKSNHFLRFIMSVIHWSFLYILVMTHSVIITRLLDFYFAVSYQDFQGLVSDLAGTSSQHWQLS